MARPLKISVHKGTAFKHREAFFRNKRLQPSKISTKGSETEGPYAPYQSAYRSSAKLRWILQLVGTVVALAAIIAIVATILSDFPDSPQFTSQAAETEQRKADAETQNAYRMLINAGNGHLASNNLDWAQRKFVSALEIDTYGKEACVGLMKTLFAKCETQGVYCEEAEENLVFIQKMTYATEQELEYYFQQIAE